MLSTDVKLPRDFKPEFPDDCIRCHGETFRNTFRVSTRDLRVASVLFWFLIGKKVCVDVPCCESCVLRMRIQRWGSGLLTLLLILAGGFLLFPMLAHLDRSIRRLAMIVLGVICISPVVIWEVLWPPTFDISSTQDSITYEFQNPDDAQAFASLNEDAPGLEIS